MTIRALSTAATGMIAQQLHVDVLANNLANVNTIGYKKSRANFQDLIYQSLQRSGTSLSADQDQKRPSGVQIGLGVRESSVQKIHTQGPLANSGLQTDIAIDGEGFFQIKVLDNQAPNGVGYTRAGAFTIDSNGQLVTPNGYLLEPPITVPENTVAINVSIDGTVEAVQQNVATATQVGTIQLATFRNPGGLHAIGDSLLTETDSSGAAQTQTPGQAGTGILRQGFLEQSNVQVVQELVELIQAQRAYEVNANSIESADEMLKTANNLRR